MERKSRNRLVVLVAVIIIALLQFGFWGGCWPRFCREFARARESARRATCKNNLMHIGRALHSYAYAHDGKFPQGESAAEVLSNLIDEGYLRAESNWSGVPPYVCPSARADLRAWKEVRKPTQDTVSYEWVAGLDLDSPDDFAVMFERSAEHHRWIPRGSVVAAGEGYGGVGRNVLYVDARVRWNGQERFQATMSWQREMMERAKRGGEYIPFKLWLQLTTDSAAPR